MMTSEKVLHPLAVKEAEKRHWPLMVFRILFTLLLAACILTIFNHSLEVGVASSARSERVTALLNQGLEHLHTGIVLENALVRKLAHLLEYTALGFLMMLATRAYTCRLLGHISWPLFLGLLIAVMDEILQTFTMGRSGQLIDVGLDFSGVLLGVVAGLFILLLGRQFWRELMGREKVR